MTCEADLFALAWFRSPIIQFPAPLKGILFFFALFLDVGDHAQSGLGPQCVQPLMLAHRKKRKEQELAPSEWFFRSYTRSKVLIHAAGTLSQCLPPA